MVKCCISLYLVYSEFLESGIYLSTLHEELEAKPQKGFYVPDIIIYQVLKDSDPETMVNIMFDCYICQVQVVIFISGEERYYSL